MSISWTYRGLPVVSVFSGMSQEDLPMRLHMNDSWMGDRALLKVVQKISKFLNYNSERE